METEITIALPVGHYTSPPWGYTPLPAVVNTRNYIPWVIFKTKKKYKGSYYNYRILIKHLVAAKKIMEQRHFSIAAEFHKQSLLAQALKLTADQEDAKDLLQDTLIKAVRSCDKFAEGTNFRGWMFVIMKNTFYNSYIKQRRRASIWEGLHCATNQKLQNATVNNLSETSLVLDDVEKAMSTLRSGYRIAFQRHVEGYSYEEIAIELHIPIGTVKTNIYKARHGLKKYLHTYR